MDDSVEPTTAEVVPAGHRPPMPLTLPNLEAIEPSHFDGWDGADIADWLVTVGPSFGAIRRGIGLALWHLRQRVSDGEYGQVAAKLAQVAGVTDRTVRQWRTDAESYYSLAIPSKRAEANRSPLRKKLPESTQSGSAPESLSTPPTLSVVTEPPPVRSPNHPSVQAAVLGAASELATDDDEWEDCPRCRERPGKVRKSTPKVNNGCGHALVRRLGDRCQDCGEKVGPNPFAGKR